MINIFRIFSEQEDLIFYENRGRLLAWNPTSYTLGDIYSFQKFKTETDHSYTKLYLYTLTIEIITGSEENNH